MAAAAASSEAGLLEAEEEAVSGLVGTEAEEEAASAGLVEVVQPRPLSCCLGSQSVWGLAGHVCCPGTGNSPRPRSEAACPRSLRGLGHCCR